MFYWISGAIIPDLSKGLENCHLSEQKKNQYSNHVKTEGINHVTNVICFRKKNYNKKQLERLPHSQSKKWSTIMLYIKQKWRNAILTSHQVWFHFHQGRSINFPRGVERLLLNNLGIDVLLFEGLFSFLPPVVIRRDSLKWKANK